MFKTIYRSLLNLLLLCLLVSSSLAAQNVIVTQPDCSENCFVFTIAGDFDNAAEFIWTIEGSNGIVFNPIISFVPTVFWCAPPSANIDEFTVFLTIYEGANETYEYSDLFSGYDPVETSILATGTHQTACTEDYFIDDNDEPFSDCYDVCVGATSTITINELFLAGSPVGGTPINPHDGEWTVINGQVVSDPYPPQEIFDGFTLVLPEVYAQTGDVVCLPMTCYNFDGILGMQFSVNYDPAALIYIGAQNFTPQLLGFNVGSIGNPSPGNLTATSNDPLATGVTLDDNTILVELCFTVIGSATSYLPFSSSPTTIEVVDGNENAVDPNFSTGAVILEEPSLNSNSISVLWEEEGLGVVHYSIWFTNAQGCPAFYELEFCFNVTPLPPADISTLPPLENGILEVCAGQTIFFFNEAEDVETYSWDFDDGSSASIQNPSHAYINAGSYEVQLITQSDCDCVDTSMVNIYVQGNETPFIDCVATICEETTSTYTANTGCNQYNWGISDNGIILDGGGTDDDFVTIQWGAGPIGDITLETDGCPDLSTCTEAAYIQIPIISANASVEGPERVCPGDQAVYSLPPFEGVEFDWDVSIYGTILEGQGTNSVTIEWTDIPLSVNNHIVSVSYTNCYLECGGDASKVVYIRPEFYTRGEIEVCENTTSNYNVINTRTNGGFPADFKVKNTSGTVVWMSSSASNMASVDWNFGAGIYTIETTAQTPSSYCTEIYSFLVRVIEIPAPPTGIVGQMDICPDILYSYTVQDPIEDEEYRWTITNGVNVTEKQGQSIVVNWGNTEPYLLSVIRLSPPQFCASVPISLTMNVVNVFNINGDADACVDNIASYETDQTGDLYYEWSILPVSAGTIVGESTASTIEVLWHVGGVASVVLNICGQQEGFAVDVHAVPLPMVNAPADICPGEMEIVNTTQSYSSYRWYDENGFLSAGPTPSLGSGSYHLEVTDNIGCIGTTSFLINDYPTSVINISTPDFNVFCNVQPLTRIYAVNTEDGYTYQWLRNGVSIVSETGTNYTATETGIYQVEIVDENNCTFSSNTIAVAEDCSGGNGDGGSDDCPNADHHFVINETGICNERNYTATVDGSIPGSVSWNFNDPYSNLLGTGLTTSHTFSEAGFYRVIMGASYDDGMGNEVTCFYVLPDTIYAVADFDYKEGCVGSPMQFLDISTYISDFTNITDWEWNFSNPSSGASNISNLKDPLHTFTNDGGFDVSLTVTTATGCTASITKSIIISPLPIISFDEPDVTCSLTALPFSANIDANVVSVEWDFGDPVSMNANSSTLVNSYHAYDEATSFMVSLDATDTHGCTNTFTRDINVTVNDLTGEIDPAGLNLLCEGETMNLTAPLSTAIQWEWTTGEQTQGINVNETDNYGVTLTSVEGCVYSPNVTSVEVVSRPQSPIRSIIYNNHNQAENYTYDTLFVCQGEEVFLETEHQTGYEYSWSSSDTDNTTEFSELRGNILSAGTHTVMLEVTDTESGCLAVEVFVIIVYPTPEMPIINGVDEILCSETIHSFTVQNPDVSLNYLWSNGENGTSITTDVAGVYRVIAMTTDGCRTESNEVKVLDGPNLSLLPSGCHTRCGPDTICLPILPNIVNYQWYQDGVIIPAPNGNIGELIIEESGAYTLEMEDENGCVLTSDPVHVDILDGYGTILGQVYFDINENQTLDVDDIIAPGIIIELDNGNTPLFEINTSDLGYYGFVNIPEDDYTLTIDSMSLPNEWQAQIVSIDTTFEGCDQEVIINWLLVRDCFDTSFVAVVCENEDFLFRGNFYPVGSEQTIQISSLDGLRFYIYLLRRRPFYKFGRDRGGYLP